MSQSDVVDVTRWTHERLNWHLRICCDPALRDRAKLLASLLLHDFDLRRGGCAWRGQTGENSLTARAGWKDARTVQLAAQELEAAGYLRIERGQGRGRSNRYWPIFGKKADADQCFEGEKRPTQISHFEPENPDQDQPFIAEKADVGAEKGGSASALHRKEPANTLSERERAFETLVGCCPSGMLKFVDLGAARGAFDQLLGDGQDPARLAQALARMAAAPEYQGRKHPPQLHDWLSKGMWRGWLDAPPAAAEPAAQPSAFAHELPPEIAGPLEQIDGIAPYLARATWAAEARTLYAATGVAAERLVERIGRARLADLQITIARRPVQ